MIRRRLPAALLALLATAGLLLSTGGVAHADVVVRPGGSGSICTEYHFMKRTPTQNVYWQTCAWADSDEVWFTIHFGNSGSTAFILEEIDLGFDRSGYPYLCPHEYFPQKNLVLNPHSVQATRKFECVLPRARAAYAAWAYVDGLGVVAEVDTTDSLQVQ